MLKICLESRDEIRIINLQQVIYLQVNHNYTDFRYANGRTKSELINLSALEEQIADTASRLGVANPFVRVGRNLLVNTSHIEVINLKRQGIVFKTVPPAFVGASRFLLRTLKEKMVK